MKWLILELGQEIHKINLKGLRVTKSKKALKRKSMRYVKGTQKPNERSLNEIKNILSNSRVIFYYNPKYTINTQENIQ